MDWIINNFLFYLIPNILCRQIVVIIPEQKTEEIAAFDFCAQKFHVRGGSFEKFILFVPVKYWRKKLIKRREGIDKNEPPSIYRQKNV